MHGAGRAKPLLECSPFLLWQLAVLVLFCFELPAPACEWLWDGAERWNRQEAQQARAVTADAQRATAVAPGGC